MSQKYYVVWIGLNPGVYDSWEACRQQVEGWKGAVYKGFATREEAEEAINRYRDQLREEHLNALKKGTYDFAIGNAYSSLYALYEKLGDYVINISEAIVVKYK